MIFTSIMAPELSCFSLMQQRRFAEPGTILPPHCSRAHLQRFPGKYPESRVRTKTLPWAQMLCASDSTTSCIFRQIRRAPGPFAPSGTIAWAPATRLGYVPQKIATDRQLPIQARDLLAAKARILKLSPGEVAGAAEAVEPTSDLLATSIGVLSGGQFQKALIAFALLGNPNVLLFDEPTASLDELGEERIYALLADLQRVRQLTIVLVSHDLSVVYQSANKVVCLSKDTVYTASMEHLRWYQNALSSS